MEFFKWELKDGRTIGYCLLIFSYNKQAGKPEELELTPEDTLVFYTGPAKIIECVNCCYQRLVTPDSEASMSIVAAHILAAHPKFFKFYYKIVELFELSGVLGTKNVFDPLPAGADVWEEVHELPD